MLNFMGNLCKSLSKMDILKALAAKASLEKAIKTEKDSEKKRHRQWSLGADSKACHLVCSVPTETELGL